MHALIGVRPPFLFKNKKARITMSKLRGGNVSLMQYRKRKDVEDHFLAGRDLRNCNFGTNGTYCSIRDFEVGSQVEVYYDHGHKSLRIEVPQPEVVAE